MVLDCPGGPDVITRVLVKRKQESKTGDVTLEATGLEGGERGPRAKERSSL